MTAIRHPKLVAIRILPAPMQYATSMMNAELVSTETGDAPQQRREKDEKNQEQRYG